jgi:hypothetical protein
MWCLALIRLVLHVRQLVPDTMSLLDIGLFKLIKRQPNLGGASLDQVGAARYYPTREERESE